MIDEWKELRAFIIKLLLPALMGLSIKLAILSRKEHITIKQVMISFVCGIGSAYLFSPWIIDSFADHWQPLAIAVITISGEKIGSYALYKINVDRLIDFLIKKK